MVEEILKHWFVMNHKTPGFLTVFVRAFRLSKLVRAILDSERFWSKLVDHLVSGNYHKVLEEASKPNADYATRLKMYASMEPYDIIPAEVHAGNLSFRDHLVNPKHAAAIYLGEIDQKIIHHARPFGSEDKFLVKIGDVGLSKRKICCALLAYKRPVTTHQLVQFLLAMQCIPAFPTKAFSWMMTHPIALDPFMKNFMDETLQEIIRNTYLYMKDTINRAQFLGSEPHGPRSFLGEYTIQKKALLSLRVLVRIFSNEYQPWSETKLTQKPDSPETATMALDHDAEMLRVYPASAAELDSIEQTFDALEVGRLVKRGNQPGYSHGTRGLLACDVFSRFPKLMHIPRHKLRVSYFNHAVRSGSDASISSLLLSKPSGGMTVVDFINKYLGPHSLGAADTALVMTKDALDFSRICLDSPRFVGQTRRHSLDLAFIAWTSLIQKWDCKIKAGMHVFFERYLLTNDPFILWTIAKLSMVSKAFYEVFGARQSPVWRALLHCIRGARKEGLPHPNEAKLARQLGIDPDSYFEAKSSGDVDEDIRDKYSLAQTRSDDFIDHVLPKFAVESTSFNLDLVLMTRLMVFYRLPRDRACSFVRTFICRMSASMEDILKTVLGVVEHMTPTAVYAFNHCGSFMDYIMVLRRSKADRTYEAKKIECQIKMNDDAQEVMQTIFHTALRTGH